MRTDVYQKITDQIVAALESGVRPWHQPWKAEHSAGRITRPLRGNGIPYQGINVLMLWSAAIEKGYAAPIWMTFKQALDLKANVRKGEHGSLVVYADKIIRTETTESGEDAERAIPFMKGYTGLAVGREFRRQHMGASLWRGRNCEGAGGIRL
jgi:antirestriction protein ArdC